jgi:hypothetical protein
MKSIAALYRVTQFSEELASVAFATFSLIVPTSQM